MSLLSHLQLNYDTHLAAASATGLTLCGGQIISSVIVGVLVFAITNGIKWIIKQLRKVND